MKILFFILSVLWLVVSILITSVFSIVLSPLFLFNKKLYFNFLLLFFAKVSQLVINIFGFIYEFWHSKNKSEYIINIAIVEDIKANAVNGLLFSDVFLKQQKNEDFGTLGETISDNLGENQNINNLTKVGLLIAKILNFLDKNHTQNAIKNGHTTK